MGDSVATANYRLREAGVQRITSSMLGDEAA
jgi:hypothetical protein